MLHQFWLEYDHAYSFNSTKCVWGSLTESMSRSGRNVRYPYIAHYTAAYKLTTAAAGRLVTSPAAAVAKYCNEHVCVSVCLSASICVWHGRTISIMWSMFRQRSAVGTSESDPSDASLLESTSLRSQVRIYLCWTESPHSACRRL